MANHTTTLKTFEQQLGETITHIVIGTNDNCRWHDDEDTIRPPKDKTNIILDRDTGLTILDEEYFAGYGGADCFPFYAWSENYLFTVSEYDGATGISYWPRHPINIKPQFD